MEFPRALKEAARLQIHRYAERLSPNSEYYKLTVDRRHPTFNDVVRLIKFHAKRRELCSHKPTAKNRNPCKHDRMEVDPSYVAYAMSNASHLVFVYRQKRGRENTAAFAILQNKKTHVYLDVICSKPGAYKGSFVLREVEKLTRSLGKTQIRLKALPHVICYYARKGYRKFKESRSNNKGFKHSPRSCLRMTENLCSNGCDMVKDLTVPSPSSLPPPECRG